MWRQPPRLPGSTGLQFPDTRGDGRIRPFRERSEHPASGTRRPATSKMFLRERIVMTVWDVPNRHDS